MTSLLVETFEGRVLQLRSWSECMILAALYPYALWTDSQYPEVLLECLDGDMLLRAWIWYRVLEHPL